VKKSSSSKKSAFLPVVTLETSLKSALNKSLFRGWLNSKPASEPAGVCNDPSQCGIANYLQAVYPEATRIRVDGTSAEVTIDGDTYAEADVSLPGWARAFVRKFDKVGEINERKAAKKGSAEFVNTVSVKDTRAILRAIKAA
jgi:hypothetical protein